MDIIVSDILFEGSGYDVPELPPDVSLYTTQMFQSGHAVENILYIDKFLDEDRTINLEKLELAVLLLIEYLEFSIKLENPIYVFLGNMRECFNKRGIQSHNLEQISEESSFILGFVNSIAEENSTNRKVVVQYAIAM